jgi:hypothetical protein
MIFRFRIDETSQPLGSGLVQCACIGQDFVPLFPQRQLEHARSISLQASFRKGPPVPVQVFGALVPTAPAGACPCDVTARPLSVRVRLCQFWFLGSLFLRHQLEHALSMSLPGLFP